MFGGHSPPVAIKALSDQRRFASTSDLSSEATTSSSTITTVENAHHSPKQQRNTSVKNFAFSPKKQNEIKINLNASSAFIDNVNKSLPSTNETIANSDVGASSINDIKTNSDVRQCLVQTGIDRYITVQPKRKRSPRSQASASMSKSIRLTSFELTNGNRFSSLMEADEDDEHPPKILKKIDKPPPIYLREESNKKLANAIELLTEGNFYISGIKKGNIKETKIQPLNIDAYRALIAHFDQTKKNYYTYQLKSQKGLVVIIKGIESFVDPNDINVALADKGFNVKSITNIINRDKVPQPMFRLELEPDNKKLKGKHEIFSLKYLLHRRITIDEPRKRTGPIQCVKCQEYGHSKTYCTLNDVCVICGDLHNSKQCNKNKSEASVRRCSNCGGNHTANYRGCPVYLELKRRINPRQRAEQRMLNSIRKTEVQQNVPQMNIHNGNQNATVNSSRQPGVSYASILKGTTPNVQPSNEGNISSALDKLTDMMRSFMAMMERSMDLMMQNMNMLMQIVAKNQK